MATVTKPIALDKSLNTTEQTPRNVADVLAQELARIAGKQASDVEYDNTASGLTADNVQGAIDELKSNIPTVNDGTLTIQQNGEAKGTFTANQSGNSTVNIETPTTDIQTAVDEFETYNGGLLSECIVELVPVQSGSGDPSPDNVRPISGHTEVDLYNVGKNKLPFHIDNVKSNNLGGTWSENIYTYKNVNWIFDVDADGYIQKVTANGLASAESSITVLINDYIKADTLFKYNGVPTGGGSSTYQAFIRGGGYDRGSGNAITPTQANIDNDYYWYRIAIANGYNAQNVVFYPMIYVGDDATYEPYLGHLYQVQIGSTVYGGTIDLVSGSGEDAYINIASYNGETINEPWISSMDVYTEGGTPTTGAQVVYPKTTATAISTTPQQIETLAGQNNLSTPLDGQSIDSVEYREVFTFDDVEKVVSLRVPISMLGTDESGRTTASQSYASGDYFYKDGYMCKALTSISAGATLTLNTNYSQGTLADILKAIENA